MLRPKVSVITPCYNSEKYVGRTIESVRAQTFSAWEHVVVDDGSTDESSAAVKAYLGRKPRLRLVEQTNGGVSRARNRGYASATPGEYLLFLDSDDCPEPHMLEVLAGYLDTHSEVGMVYGKPIFVDADDHVVDGTGLFNPRYVPCGHGRMLLPETEPETPFLSLFNLCGHLPSLTLMRESVYSQIGGWDEALGHIYEDTDLFLRMALQSSVHYLPEPLLRYRRHPAQATASETSDSRAVAQQAKMYAKWDGLTSLPPDQQAKLDEARAFRDNCMVPLAGLHSGMDCLRDRKWRKALWFFRHTAFRYAASRRAVSLRISSTNL